jgi:hypothetical protein
MHQIASQRMHLRTTTANRTTNRQDTIHQTAHRERRKQTSARSRQRKPATTAAALNSKHGLREQGRRHKPSAGPRRLEHSSPTSTTGRNRDDRGPVGASTPAPRPPPSPARTATESRDAGSTHLQGTAGATTPDPPPPPAETGTTAAPPTRAPQLRLHQRQKAPPHRQRTSTANTSRGGNRTKEHQLKRSLRGPGSTQSQLASYPQPTSRIRPDRPTCVRPRVHLDSVTAIWSLKLGPTPLDAGDRSICFVATDWNRFCHAKVIVPPFRNIRSILCFT